jgi:hypothetical protein
MVAFADLVAPAVSCVHAQGSTYRPRMDIMEQKWTMIAPVVFLAAIYVLQGYVIPDRYLSNNPTQAVIGWMIVMGPLIILAVFAEIYVRIHERLRAQA